MPIPCPKYNPAQQDGEDYKAKEVKKAESNCIVVAQLLENQILSYLARRHNLEHNLHAIVHRRDPREELDHWIGVISCVCKAPCSKVKEGDAQISNQNCHILIVSHRTDWEAKKAARRCNPTKREHVCEKIRGSPLLKLEAVEGDECEQDWVDPDTGETLSKDGQVIRVHGVHMIWDLSLKNWIILRYLHDLAKKQVDQLVTGD